MSRHYRACPSWAMFGRPNMFSPGPARCHVLDFDERITGLLKKILLPLGEIGSKFRT
jgi:hypothetical protein